MSQTRSTSRDGARDAFLEHRSLLVGVAYRVLGTMSDAEDVVQDAWLRWSRISRADIEDPRRYLVTIVSRLAIDGLRRRQARREQYVGEWLPEPIAAESDPSVNVELAESLSVGLLVVLESLTPLERAVFVLHDAFGFSFGEIAGMLSRSEPAVRQVASRARKHVQARRPRFDVDPVQQREVTQRFVAAATHGDVDGLMAVLAPDVVLLADGGGKVRAPLLPVTGADKIVRFLVAAAGRIEPGQHLNLTELNGQPAVVVTAEDGQAIVAIALEIRRGRIERLYVVGNPEKLRSVSASAMA